MFIGYNSCQGGKWNVIQVFNWSVCQPSWFILQNKCMVDARWPLESRAESDFGHLSSRLVCLFTPGKICHELWVGSGHRQHTSPSGTDNPRLPTLFWWAMSSSYAKNNALSMISCTFSDICSRRSCQESPEIKNLENFMADFDWCKDRDNLGLSRS